jgi:hypothetical protein
MQCCGPQVILKSYITAQVPCAVISSMHLLTLECMAWGPSRRPLTTGVLMSWSGAYKGNWLRHSAVRRSSSGLIPMPLQQSQFNECGEHSHRLSRCGECDVR